MNRRQIVLALSILAVVLPPLLPRPFALAAAVWAKDGRDDGKDSDNSGSGSEKDDRDDHGGGKEDDDRDHDRSGKGSGSGVSGSGSSGSGAYSGGKSPVSSASDRDPFGDAGLHVFLADGGREILRNGTYLRLNRAGQVTERRDATARDRRRLTTLSRSLRGPGQGLASGVAVVERRRVELRDDRGWVEILDGNRYELIDPNGNIVTRRRATAQDLARVRQQLGL